MKALVLLGVALVLATMCVGVVDVFAREPAGSSSSLVVLTEAKLSQIYGRAQVCAECRDLCHAGMLFQCDSGPGQECSVEETYACYALGQEATTGNEEILACFSAPWASLIECDTDPQGPWTTCPGLIMCLCGPDDTSSTGLSCRAYELPPNAVGSSQCGGVS